MNSINTVTFFMLRGLELVDYSSFLNYSYFIFFVCFLNNKILHLKFHRHHFLGLLVNSIGIFLNIFIGIKLIIRLFGDDVVDTLIVILPIINCILLSLQECLEKYMLDYKYVSPYAILSFEGIVGVVFIGILTFIADSIPCGNLTELLCAGIDGKEGNRHLEDISLIFNQITIFPNFIYFLVLMLAFYCYDIAKVLTHQHFSPVHRYIGDAFGYMLIWFYLFIVMSIINKSDRIPGIAIFGTTIGFVLIFIGSFIYLEIIVIKACNLDKNTKKEIALRDNDETNELYSELNQNSINSITIDLYKQK